MLGKRVSGLYQAAKKAERLRLKYGMTEQIRELVEGQKKWMAEKMIVASKTCNEEVF